MKIKLLLITLLGTLRFSSNAQNFLWAKAIGGTTGFNEGNSIAVDAAGNVYTTGYFQDTVDFDPGAGVFNLISSAGSQDIFILKLDASGNFVWAKKIGGVDDEVGKSIALDAVGNVYTTGYFHDTVDFDPGPGAFNLISPTGYQDIFISKLDASGNFIWAKKYGDVINGGGNSIVVDASGNVYTTGYFDGWLDCDPGPGIFNLMTSGMEDIFISRLDSSGNFVWAKRMGGSNHDDGNSIAVDLSGNVYTTGYFKGIGDFDPGVGVFNLTSVASSQDIFISKLDSSGNFVYAKSIGDSLPDNGLSIAVDALGNAYTTGDFQATADFDPGTGVFNLTPTGNRDGFICKLDASGNFDWAKAIGGTGYYDSGNSITVDASGNAYTTGYFNGTADFDPGAGVFNLTSNGGDGIFISKLDSSGNFVYAKAMTGTFAPADGFAIVVDTSGNVYTTGRFYGTVDFDPGAGVYNLTQTSDQDIFVAKLSGKECMARYFLFPDTTPHNWFALNQAIGVPPITYTWNWGDGATSTGTTPSHTYSSPGYYNICLSITDSIGCNDIFCDSSTYLFRGNNSNTIINISVVDSNPLMTGISFPNPSSDDEINIYPNPTTSIITLSSTTPNNYYELYDVTGNLLKRENITATKFEIDLSRYSGGIYFLTVGDKMNSHPVVHGRIVKE